MASRKDVVKSVDDKTFHNCRKKILKGLSGSKFKLFQGYVHNGTNSAYVVLVFTGSRRPLKSAEQMLQQLIMDEGPTVKTANYVHWSGFEFLKRFKVVEEAGVLQAIYRSHAAFSFGSRIRRLL